MESSPSVSVIMPVRNEGAYIRRSLGSVMAQDYPASRLEILVVDGMSNDGTREYVRSLQGERHNLYLIDNPAGIVPPGLNLGIRQALGDIIIRVDGHCEIAPDYVSRCVQHLMDDGPGHEFLVRRRRFGLSDGQGSADAGRDRRFPGLHPPHPAAERPIRRGTRSQPGRRVQLPSSEAGRQDLALARYSIALL
jgi:glycosyltransferase involved in cell wall biosynthesis